MTPLKALMRIVLLLQLLVVSSRTVLAIPRPQAPPPSQPPQPPQPPQAPPFAPNSTQAAGPNSIPQPTLGYTSGYWVASIPRQGSVAYASNPASYNIFRNVKDYGAAGDGVTDDTQAINAAISDGPRCGQGCDSSTTTPAIVYFPPGVYSVSAPIIQYYYTQFIGDAINPPTIKATASFSGIAVIDSDPYEPGGINWYTNQNNFYRQIRNFVIDITSMPMSSGSGIHWQVAQATSLQNIVFNMVQGGGSANKQQGIFMDNGSGGFMSDLVFNGGNYGAFLGNQQFTTRNLTFNGCQTAIFMNWNWVWTLKSVCINNCGVGINMANLGLGGNQSVGSIILMDSSFSNTPIGVQTAFSAASQPNTGGTLIIDNVDFTGTQMAVAASDGSQILAGGSLVASWAQGNTYTPQVQARRVKRAPQLVPPVKAAADCTWSVPPASSTTTISTTVTSSSYVTIFPIPVSPSSGAATSAAASSAPSWTFSYSPSSNATSTLPSTSTASYTFSTAPGSCTAPANPVASSRVQQQLTAPSIPAVLLDGDKFFERSKPQYEGIPVSAFVSVKSQGAKGDGVTDDTQAIQNVFNSVSADQIVYFDHGAYVISDTVAVPKDVKITGEIWPLIMALGTAFSDATQPKPVFQIGNPGDVGSVEISDLIFETLGPAAGAILMEWNVQESSQGSCGMWDVHFRVGGTAGTQLQSDRCPGNTTDTQDFNPECAGSFLMLHITQQASAYVENVWLWTADHELDLPDHSEVNIYNGRGMLVESQGPVWLYGTSVEHSQLYNYQIANAQNVFMGVIQTETAYMQSSPNALDAGFTPNAAFSDDDFSTCTSDTCKKTWGLRVTNSQDVYVYGAGLYSFFNDYTQQCLADESCQENMVAIECSSAVSLYGLSTKGTTNMVVVNSVGQALQADNTNEFCQTVALFEQT